MQAPDRPHAFTLLELVLSLAITSVLAVAVSSAIFIATQSLPRSGDMLDAAVDMSLLDDALRGEVELATAILDVSDKRIEFLVADRDGDEIEERIELSWSGGAGTPLTRKVNGGAPVEVLSAVHTSTTAVRTSTPNTFVSTSAVTPAASAIDGGFIDGGWSPLYPNGRLGLRVLPPLPAPVTHWRLTGVDLYLRWPDASTGEYLEIRAGLPVTSTVDPHTHSLRQLIKYDIHRDGQWVSVPLRTPWLPRNEAVTVGLHNKVGVSTPSFRFKVGTMPTGLTWLAAAGSNWVDIVGNRYAVRVSYETMEYRDHSVRREVVHEFQWKLGFGPKVADQTMTAHPIGLAEVQR